MNHTALIGLLFQLSNDLHYHHLNTRSFAEHKALEYAYDSINSYKDSISEELIGLEGRLGTLKMLPVPSIKDVTSLPEDIMSLSKELRDYGTAKKYNNIVNTSDEVFGLGAKLKYLLTLS